MPDDDSLLPDDNECESGGGGGGSCSHECVNTDGSFACLCPDGLTLAPDRVTCLGTSHVSLTLHMQDNVSEPMNTLIGS